MRLIPAVLFLLGAACASPDEKNTDTLSASERDSALAESDIPGARGVAGAMRAVDSAAARAARRDSIANDP
ncbi:MAG TPA: hypothetical protein VMM77_06130 [Gemmatimonadaceae bacterium]|nr:hypothetical protein [Gemmatimonadaceae bacterium]